MSTQNPGPPDEPRVGPDPDRDFGILLGLAYQGFVTDLNEHLAAAGYDAVRPSFGYVFRLLLAEELTATKLGAKLGVTTQRAAKLADEMEATGYVERHPDPSDARVKTLRLSAKGQAAVAEARRFHQLFEDRLGAQYGDAQIAAMRAALEAIVRDTVSRGEGLIHGQHSVRLA